MWWGPGAPKPNEVSLGNPKLKQAAAPMRRILGAPKATRPVHQCGKGLGGPKQKEALVLRRQEPGWSYVKEGPTTMGRAPRCSRSHGGR